MSPGGPASGDGLAATDDVDADARDGRGGRGALPYMRAATFEEYEQARGLGPRVDSAELHVQMSLEELRQLREGGGKLDEEEDGDVSTGHVLPASPPPKRQGHDGSDADADPSSVTSVAEPRSDAADGSTASRADEHNTSTGSNSAGRVDEPAIAGQD